MGTYGAVAVRACVSALYTQAVKAAQLCDHGQIATAVCILKAAGRDVLGGAAPILMPIGE